MLIQLSDLNEAANSHVGKITSVIGKTTSDSKVKTMREK